MIVNSRVRQILSEHGVGVLHGYDFEIPDDTILEPPCCLKWMGAIVKLRLGAFSYGVSGHYQNVDIGRYVSIGENVQIGRSDHPHSWASLSPVFYEEYSGVMNAPHPLGEQVQRSNFVGADDYPVGKTITLGNDVWIGHGAFVMPGVKVGNGAVIAAGAIVTKDVPPYSIVAGVPAVVKKYRFPPDLIERFEAVQWWNYAVWDLQPGKLTEAERFLDSVEEKIVVGLQPYKPDLIVPRDLIDAP